MKNEFKVGDLVEASLHDTNGIIIQSDEYTSGRCRFLVRLINGKQRWVSPRDLRLLAAAK